MSGTWRRQTVEAYLRALASDRPTPGGGSAAALGAACGLGLLGMSARISGTPAATAAILDRLRRRTETMIDRDGAAYAEFVAALQRFRARPDRAAYERLQWALREAILVPLEVRHACEAALRQVPAIEAAAGRWIASDIRIAKGLLMTARQASGLLVRANLAVVRTPKMRRLVRGVRRQVRMKPGAKR